MHEPLGNINNLDQIFLIYDTSLDQTMTRMNLNSDLENNLLQWFKKQRLEV